MPAVCKAAKCLMSEVRRKTNRTGPSSKDSNDSKHSAAPPGIEPRVLLVARSDHVLSYEATTGAACDPVVSSSIFVGAEREENLIRNDPDKSKFTIVRI